MDALEEASEYLAEEKKRFDEALRTISRMKNFRPRELSTAFVHAQRSKSVESIFASFNFLGALLQRHEATIHKRWLKLEKRAAPRDHPQGVGLRHGTRPSPGLA